MSKNSLVVPSIEDVRSLEIHPNMLQFARMRIEAARGTYVVGYPDSGVIESAKHATKRIATGGLTGCVAVGVVTQTSDRRREAYIQHYLPTQAQVGVNALKNYLELRELSVKDSPARVIVMATGIKGGIWKHTLADKLVEVAGERLGPQTDIKMVPYSRVLGPNSLLIELLESGEAVISAEDREL